MSHFIKGKVISFDTETTGLLPFHGDRPFAFAFMNEEGDRHYFEFEVNPYTRQPIYDNPETKNIIDAMGELLEGTKVKKVMFNKKFDIRMMDCAFGIKTAGRVEEVMFKAWCCNTVEPNYKLKYLADKYATISTEDEHELQKLVQRLRNKARKEYNWNIASETRLQIAIHEDEEDEPGSGEFEKKRAAVAADYWTPFTSRRRRLFPEIVGEREAAFCRRYALLDVERTLMLDQFYDTLMDELRVRHTYEEELELFEDIYVQEARGMRISHTVNEEQKLFSADLARRSLLEVQKVAGKDFNVRSYKQMCWLMYEKLGLEIREDRRTEKGNPGTNMNAMLDYEHVPVIKHILRYRSSNKAFGYFSRYQQLMLPDTVSPGEYSIHTEIRQLKASTRRFSAVNPNLMQVTSAESSRTFEAVDARKPFGPRKGYHWLCVDYKGMEVRLYADASKDQKMLEKIAQGVEIHDEVCNEGWGGPDNPAGAKECIHVLGLDGSNISDNQQILHLWRDWGITNPNKLSPRDRYGLVQQWLKGFDYKIVQAQASVGKKVTKNKEKMVFFCKIYGGRGKAVRDLLHCTIEEAQQFLDALSRVYPRMDEYMSEQQEVCVQNDYSVRTLWDTRLCIRPWKLYQCVNYIVQGSGADLLKSAGHRLATFFKREGIDAHWLLPLHDELIIEVRKEELTKKLIRDVKAIMEDTQGHTSIPMPVDPTIAFHNWHDKYKLDKNLNVIGKD